MTTAQELAERHLPLADKLACRKKRSLPRCVDLDELKSAAYLGLAEAASRFDPSRGVSFSTYAYPRICGAIQDCLRERGLSKRGRPVRAVSLDLPCGDGRTLGEFVEARPESDVAESFECVTAGLTAQAKTVLWDYFIDDRSMRQIGERFGVTESRISQLVKQYKAQVRSHWGARENLAVELAA